MGLRISRRNRVLPMGPESPGTVGSVKSLKSYNYSEGSDREECFIWSKTGKSTKSLDDFELECPFTGTQLSFENIIKLPLFSKLNKTKKNNKIITSYFLGLNDNIKIVKKMIKNKKLNFNWCVYGAGINNSEKILNYIGKYDKLYDKRFYFLGLCQGGHLDLVIEEIKYYKKYINYGFWACCVGEQKEVINYLLSKGASNFNYGLYGACISDNIDNLIYVLNLINIDFYDIDYDGLIECGLKMSNSEIVEYLNTLKGLSKSNDNLSILDLISTCNSSMYKFN